MRSIIIFLSIVVLSSKTYAGDLLMALPEVGAEVIPNTSVDTWDGVPSRYFGNLFNDQLGSVDPDSEYVVKERVIIPNITGNQLWLQIEPKSDIDNLCGDTVCWSYFGNVEKSTTDGLGSPTPSISPESNFNILSNS